MKTAYLGPEGSYSQLAGIKLCGNCELLPYQSFASVVQALLDKSVDFAVLPVENSLNGAVTQVLDLLQEAKDIRAVKTCSLEIYHRLVTLAGADLKKITKIYSHRQALEQCAGYLNKNFPEAQQIAVTSTSASLSMLKDGSCACIAGSHTADERYTVYPQNIADESKNFTQFLLVERGEILQGTRSQYIFLSATCRHQSGALLNILKPLSNINITRLESRPIKERTGEFVFFMELQADFSDEKVISALENLKKQANSVKILGCY